MKRALVWLTLVGCSDDAASMFDAPAVDAPEVDAPAVAPDGGRPTLLSQTGLFVPGTHDIASGNELFAPTHVLWSDGAVKRRWISLPAGARVDTTDIDHWRFPVGTRFWKEFAAPDGTLLETRLIERIAATGDTEQDYWLGAFVWRADGSDAEFAEAGAIDVNGTQHDVPAAKRCPTCHRGEPGMSLGFSTMQLSGAGVGVRLAALNASGLLSTPIAETPTPGDVTIAAGIGYLHANCGHCHNPGGSAWPDASMDLRLYAADTTPSTTAVYRTAVGVPLSRFEQPGYTLRISPGDPAASGIIYRMSQRGSSDQMPPIATELVDPDDSVTTWIDSL